MYTVARMRPRSSATRYPLPATRGFTLAEVIVALALLAWGALSVVAATAAAVRAVGSAESQMAATTAARARVEHLASLRCSDLRDGSSADSSRGIREWWTVSRGRNGARLVTDSVEYSDRGTTRVLVLRRLIVC
jgi:prepilin-type N-terminal cleavage/methylation domain-containing protein